MIDFNDDLHYAESVLAREKQIVDAGIRVLSSASTVSAFSAAVMQIYRSEAAATVHLVSSSGDSSHGKRWHGDVAAP